MANQTSAHLWEVDHPYYCQEGNYFKAGQHTPFASWTDFTENTVFVTADRDQNFLIRWDWRKPGFHDWDGSEYLLLFFVLQRKAWLMSVEMPVTEADEPAVRAFLAECAATMRATWEPLLDAMLAGLGDQLPASSGGAALLHETADTGLRDRIAEALIAWTYRGKDPEHGGILETVRANAYSRADAVLAVLRAATLRELELLYRPNTTPSRPEPRLPHHTVNEEEAPDAAAPVKQRADCTELEWAEQERARFERLYTREYTRADLAEQRADTAARDAEIYQQRLERLSEGYTEQRKRAEAMERAMESTAADALAHRGCHRDLMAQCLRAERAEAEAERLRNDRAAVLREAAQRLYTALFPAVYDNMGQKAAEGVNCAVSELRRMAAEEQPAETWLTDSARIGRALIWSWDDVGVGEFGQGYRAAQAEVRALLGGERGTEQQRPVVGEQPDTQTREARP